MLAPSQLRTPYPRISNSDLCCVGQVRRYTPSALPRKPRRCLERAEHPGRRNSVRLAPSRWRSSLPLRSDNQRRFPDFRRPQTPAHRVRFGRRCSCGLTFPVTGARPPTLARHGARARVRVDWVVRLHSPSSRRTTLPPSLMNSVAWPPGYGKGLSSGELRLVNWTRTAHWSFSRAALNVQGVTDVHLSFRVRFATSMAARSLSIPSACATDIPPSNSKTAANWRLVSMKPNVRVER